MSQSEQLNIDAAVVSLGMSETAHYQAAGNAAPQIKGPVNCDYGLFVPEVGLFVADGVKRTEGAVLASHEVIGAVAQRAHDLNLAAMHPVVAAEMVYENILPYADAVLGRAKHERGIEKASATLGALLLCGQNHVAAVGIGDTMVFGQAAGSSELAPLTKSQGVGNAVFNTVHGFGRPSRFTDFPDQVNIVPLNPGDRLMIATDGLLGNRPQQLIPSQVLGEELAAAETASEAASRLASLPVRLWQAKAVIEGPRGSRLEYVPKLDDLSVGVMIISGVARAVQSS